MKHRLRIDCLLCVVERWHEKYRPSIEFVSCDLVKGRRRDTAIRAATQTLAYCCESSGNDLRGMIPLPNFFADTVENKVAQTGLLHDKDLLRYDFAAKHAKLRQTDSV